jgi:hypothetical protein
MVADDRIDECRYGNAPVKLMNADPAVPFLQGAAFDLPGKDVFTDKENGIEIRIVEKIENSYRIRVSKIK